MFTLVAAAIAGALFATRNNPKTKIRKMVILGTRTGVIYDVDLDPQLGMANVHAPDGSYAVFQQNIPPRLGFTFLRGVGNPEVIAGMKKDMAP